MISRRTLLAMSVAVIASPSIAVQLPFFILRYDHDAFVDELSLIARREPKRPILMAFERADRQTWIKCFRNVDAITHTLLPGLPISLVQKSNLSLDCSSRIVTYNRRGEYDFDTALATVPTSIYLGDVASYEAQRLLKLIGE